MLKNMKIGKILSYSFLFLCVLILAVGGLGLFNLNQSNKNAKMIYNGQLVADMQKNLVKIRSNSTFMLYERDTNKFAQRKAQIDEWVKINDDLLAKYEKSYMSDGEKALCKEYKTLLKDYRDLRDSQIDSIGKQDYTAALSIADSLTAARSKVEHKLEELIESNKEAVAKLQVDTQNASGRTFIVMIAILSVAFVMAILLGILIPRSIKRTINELVNIAEKVSVGDLNSDVPYQSKNEFGDLAKSIARVVDNLRKLIGETKMLTDASSAGNFNIRANTASFGGGYKDILDGVNHTLDTVVEKSFWYESLLNSIPNPITAADMNMNWTFVNKAAETAIGRSLDEAKGLQCSNFNVSICKTENCAITKYREKNDPLTSFSLNGLDYSVLLSPLRDTKNEQIGYVEVIRDVTKETKQATYQKIEVERLAKNLEQLARGNLDLDFNVAHGDEYTQTDREHFIKINKYFWEAKESLSSYINEIANVLDSISKSNIDVAANGDFKGDFAQIKDSLNRIVDSLNEVLMQINQSSGQVLSGAGQVASAAQALSQGSTEQASSIEELSASIEDISSQIKMNAENAKSAKEISLNSLKTVENANTQMHSMIDAMERINEASAKISKIIKTIDEIAFQTNILALNAAVEAARAGEAGKGFAVVADEVRNLASKSAEAAKETTTLIENSIQAVQQGSKIANETATTLAVIVDDAKRSGELIGQITEASILQAQAIAQTTQGVAQISNVVQNNSATAEESAAASEELSGQADMLNDLVSSFKLREACKAKAMES